MARRLLRGQVNGNVPVPLESERTALTTDPVVRPIVEDILSAYPAEAPQPHRHRRSCAQHQQPAKHQYGRRRRAARPGRERC
ncbi:MAG: hypothetical protein R2748_30555 [Bryobacterales bacterium]